VHDGDPTKPISKQSHINDFGRSLKVAGIRTVKRTHYPRAQGAQYLRLMYNTPISELQALGLWQKNALLKYYSTLASGDTVAQAAGFTGRALYYIPRIDLHPGQLQGFEDFYQDSPFAAAHEDQAKYQTVSGVPPFPACTLHAASP
jgi:hypothetical protein